MENQHRKIKGYRELSQAEIDLMNEVKALGPQIEAVLAKVSAHLTSQNLDATNAVLFCSGAAGTSSQQDYDEAVADQDRIAAAEPRRWLSIARTDLQTGLMALTRAVAQPTFF